MFERLHVIQDHNVRASSVAGILSDPELKDRAGGGGGGTARIKGGNEIVTPAAVGVCSPSAQCLPFVPPAPPARVIYGASMGGCVGEGSVFRHQSG